VERIHHPGGSHRHSVRFPVRLTEAGIHSISVRVQGGPDDKHPENDERSTTVQAADDRAKVLLIDGETRWEHHYLAAALTRDPGIELHQVVFDQPRLARLRTNSAQGNDLPALQLPPSFDPFDAVILGDVSPEQLDSEARTRLDEYVSERGGTLIIAAGKRAMPAAYFRPALEHDPMRKLLPIESARPLVPPIGYFVELTADGGLTGFLQLDATPKASAERWSDLPRHYWGIVGRAKPGASVLASPSSDTAPPAGDGSNVQLREKDNALIVRHNVGFGRVLFLGLESTWRFRLRLGDAIHHRFWGQLVRWAASDQPLIVGNRSVRFGARRAVTPQGEDVEFGVRWLDVANPLKPTDRAAMRIYLREPGKAERPVALIALQQPESRPRDLEAVARNLPAGEYQAELIIPGRTADLLSPGTNNSTSPLRASFRVTPPENVELADLSTNVSLLEEIAARTQGRVYSAEDAQQIVEELSNRQVSRPIVREWNFSRSWLTLAVLLALLGAEWSIRKLVGLP
jgi:hypothetical protein